MPKSPSFTITIITITTLILTLLFLRLLYILPATNPRRPLPRKRGSPTHLLIVLGSGGHTAEMFALIADLDPYSYNHRTYVVSAGDEFSALRAEAFERELVTKVSKDVQNPASSSSSCPSPSPPSYSIHTIPRARRIHQSLLTTPFSSLSSLLSSILLLTSRSSSSSLPTYPDLILLNGPATSAIVLLATLAIRFFDWRGTTRGKMRSIYVESWARVRNLSLSARIITLVGGAERVLVQWEGLKGKGEYRGCLIR